MKVNGGIDTKSLPCSRQVILKHLLVLLSNLFRVVYLLALNKPVRKRLFVHRVFFDDKARKLMVLNMSIHRILLLESFDRVRQIDSLFVFPAIVSSDILPLPLQT